MVLLKGRLGHDGSIAKQKVGCFLSLVVDDEVYVLHRVCRSYVFKYDILDNLLIRFIVCRHVVSVI